MITKEQEYSNLIKRVEEIWFMINSNSKYSDSRLESELHDISIKLFDIREEIGNVS